MIGWGELRREVSDLMSLAIVYVKIGNGKISLNLEVKC